MIWEAVEADEDENFPLSPEVWQIYPESRWDPDCQSGRFLLNTLLPELKANPTFQGGVVWDAFLYYTARARWGDPPTDGNAPVIMHQEHFRQIVK